MTERLNFRPHGRLLTMLGEQLIKSDHIALVEIVKNSYDADATRVWVDFQGFTDELESGPGSKIVITDNGSGMSSQVLRDAWMSPATPAKLRIKRHSAITPLGRALQGEKGIGRFAVFKLGSRVSLVTRTQGAASASKLEIDISALDEETAIEDLTSQSGERPDQARREVYLEDIGALLGDAGAVEFGDHPKKAHGTRIEISCLRSDWTESKIRRAYSDLNRLQPVLWESSELNAPDSDHNHKEEGDEPKEFAGFHVLFLRDGKSLDVEDERREIFHAILDRAVLRVTNGVVDVTKREIRFDLNDRPVALDLDDSEIRGIRPFKDYFLEHDANAIPEFKCGSFGFHFYVFDFSTTAPAEHQLDKDEKTVLRDHRIYLYRDGVRVYPYGDREDDWLQIDVIRGTQSARSMFSNDQTVGYVSITQSDNPNLRDKTNREGLLDVGSATSDFIALIQTVLAYLRSKPYEQYATANRRVRERAKVPQVVVDAQFEELRSVATPEAARIVDRLVESISAEREVAQMQIARTQDLAGVGLSVESASHDLIASGSEALRLSRLLLVELRQLGLTNEYAFTLATSLVQRLEFVDSRFQDVQGLFVSTRQKRGVVDVAQLVRRVRSMYGVLHRAKSIEFQIDDGINLRARTTEAAVLQALINLVDNATYWLMASVEAARTIRIFSTLAGELVVTDSGPGVARSDEPFIFEAFYSGKGDTGKGLGLYIAREVGARNGFEVALERPEDQRALLGATFVLRFSDVVE